MNGQKSYDGWKRIATKKYDECWKKYAREHPIDDSIVACVNCKHFSRYTYYVYGICLVRYKNNEVVHKIYEPCKERNYCKNFEYGMNNFKNRYYSNK